ncbi:MAG: protein kinase [Candidatus Aminicenantes bacterium]|nr:protein kinase [Candidatus Aminicenantes bacterium]
MRCPLCQSEISEGSRFCPECGASIADAGMGGHGVTRTIQTADSDLRIGEFFAKRYKIEQELGRGGMGIVYKAEDTKLKRPVALKLLPFGFLHIPDIRERVLREAQAAAALDHPYICTVYESDEEDGRPYITMAFIEGRELKNIIETNPLKAEMALDIAIKIAEGLREAHKKGIVHRDIKSGNIMVTQDGRAKIMDFGIAKISGSPYLTEEGTAMGTAAYMSPQQVRGEKVDHRTDLWSLGVVLYEMLIGELPFPGETAQAVFYAILNEAPLPLKGLNAGLAEEMEKVIFKALVKDVNLRYGSADEFLQDLNHVKAGMPVAAPFPSEKGMLNSVAVIDFSNLTKDPSCDWLSGGIAETVSVDLNKIASLRVVSREKVLKILGTQAGENITEKEVINLGKTLGVRWVIWGGFQKMGNAVRITSRFTEISSGEVIGSAKVDGNMEDIFKLQDQIIDELIQSLHMDVSETEKEKIASPETLEVEAYELYARGRQIINRMGREGMPKAQEFFEKAMKKDPYYALAYSGLGNLLTIKFIAMSKRADLEAAIVYLQKAIELDPDLTDPYLWLTYGYTREQRYRDAINSGKRAVELESDNPLAHYFLGAAYHIQAAMEYQIDKYPKALDHYRINVKIQPNYQPAYMNAAWIHILHGNYKEAEEKLKKAVDIEESGKAGIVTFVGSLTLMGNLFLRQKLYADAMNWYGRSLQLLAKTDHVYTGVFQALTHCGIGQIELTNRNNDKALQSFKKAKAIIDEVSHGLGIGYVLVKTTIGMAKAFHELGMSQESKSRYRESLHLVEKKEAYDFSWIWEGSDAQAYYDLASYQALLNRPQEAFAFLKKAMDCGWSDLPQLENDDCFDALRGLPEYKRIIRSHN